MSSHVAPCMSHMECTQCLSSHSPHSPQAHFPTRQPRHIIAASALTFREGPLAMATSWDCNMHVSKQAKRGESMSEKDKGDVPATHRKRVENKQICKTCQGNKTHANTRNHACKMKHCSLKAHPNLQCEPARAHPRNALQIAQLAYK